MDEGVSEWLGTSETWLDPKIHTLVKPAICLQIRSLNGMQSLALLVALSPTVGWESLGTAWFSAGESSLSGMRVHVTWLSVSCEKPRQTEKNSRSLAKYVVKLSPHTSHEQLEDDCVKNVKNQRREIGLHNGV
jgi:hypothetical protein